MFTVKRTSSIHFQIIFKDKEYPQIFANINQQLAEAQN